MTFHRDRNGVEVSWEYRRTDGAGREVVVVRTLNQEVTEVTGNGHTVRVETYYDLNTDTTEVRTIVDGRPVHSGRMEGVVWSEPVALQRHDQLFRRGRDGRNVDPDSPYGKGGSPVDIDRRPDDIVHASDAKDGVGPGARPDQDARAGVARRLNVNVDLAGQPNPVEGRGDGGVGYHGRGYHPDDLVRPPRPNDP
ncbi:MAG: hypothetical protein N2652_05705 [Kiritimatiellae bacterium]|nr:hypothetical protein [Kiritimatiellia bacterium]